MSETLERVTVAASVESQKLQRHFGRFDILFFRLRGGCPSGAFAG